MKIAPSKAKLESQVKAFNRTVKVGDPVLVRLDDGTITETKTKGPAYILGGHSAVILLEGISGAYLLSRVNPGIR